MNFGVFMIFILITSLNSVGVMAKKIENPLKGKTKFDESAWRQELCKNICIDSHSRVKGIRKNFHLWNDSHQICACWDNTAFRINIKKEGCLSRKDLPPFLSGKIDSCSHMCKEFMVDNTSDEQIQLRDAFMCYAKIIDGYTSHCICDFKSA